MTSLSSADEGDRVTVKIKKHDSQLVITQTNGECQLKLNEPPDLEEEQETEVTGTVTKIIYDRSGSLEMVFLSAESDATSTPSTTKTKTRNPDSQSTTSGTGSTRSSKSSSDSTRSSVQSSGKSDSRSSSKGNSSLDKIAEELIGDKELEVDSNDESVLSEAKRKAKSQDRDPAIDPKFNDT